MYVLKSSTGRKKRDRNRDRDREKGTGTGAMTATAMTATVAGTDTVNLFPIYYLLKSRTGRKKPPLKNHPQNCSIFGVVLQGGSSYTRFLWREHSS